MDIPMRMRSLRTSECMSGNGKSGGMQDGKKNDGKGGQSFGLPWAVSVRSGLWQDEGAV